MGQVDYTPGINHHTIQGISALPTGQPWISGSIGGKDGFPPYEPMSDGMINELLMQAGAVVPGMTEPQQVLTGSPFQQPAYYYSTDSTNQSLVRDPSVATRLDSLEHQMRGVVAALEEIKTLLLMAVPTLQQHSDLPRLDGDE